MAKRSGGFKAPKNYVPGKKGAVGGRRGKPGAGQDAAGRDERGTSSRQNAGKRGRDADGREALGRGNSGRESSGRGDERKQGRPRAGSPQDDRGRQRSGRADQTPRGRRGASGQDARQEPRPRAKPRARDEREPRIQTTERRKTGGYLPPEDVVLERLDAKITTAADAENVSFADLGLEPRLIDALAELGAEAPFPIQVATIPDALGGQNVLGRGRTGSGKTIAFAAALVQRLYWQRGKRKQSVGRPPHALVLAPTRELALQLDRTIQPLARALGLFTTQLYGGVPYTKQNTSLKRGVDIVIGTPGRIEDLAERGQLDLSQVVITVLDEADEMSDMGFIEPVERILALTRPTGQRMLFSATLDAQVRELVAKFMPQPSVHEVADDAVGEIEHRVLIVDRRDRPAVLAQLASSGGRVLIFRRMRAGAEELARALADHGVHAVALHGDLNQAQRTENLREFTEGRVDVLVATDVAARGIHVDDVRLVVQADPPDDYKAYLHRAGRTGRAGNRGTVVTLIQPGREARITGILENAEIEAPFLPASPGSAALDEFLAN